MQLAIAMCTLFILSLGLAETDVMRNKRDLATIRNFLYSLFGANNNKVSGQELIYTTPIKGNIYRIKNGDNVFIRTVPGYSSSPGIISESNSYLSKEIPSHKFFTGRTDTESDVYKTYNEACCNSESDVIVTKQNDVVHTPLYIQNRLREIIHRRNNIQPVTATAIESLVVPQNRNPVHVSKYPFDRVAFKEPIKVPANVSKSPLSLNTSEYPITHRPQQINSFRDTDITGLKANAGAASVKSVKFSEPIPSRYSYKNIYYSEPNKNTIVEYNRGQIVSNTKELNAGNSAMKTSENMSSYPSTNRRRDERENLANNPEDMSFKHNPIVVLDEHSESHRNERNSNFFSIAKYNQRGDIPDVMS